jgi:hypothetical protein
VGFEKREIIAHETNGCEVFRVLYDTKHLIHDQHHGFFVTVGNFLELAVY